NELQRDILGTVILSAAKNLGEGPARHSPAQILRCAQVDNQRCAAARRSLADRRRPGTLRERSPMIQIEGLVKGYDAVAAVDGLSPAVAPGEILGLVGPNGAGKTTTLRCLAGILPPTSGRIAIAGHDLAAEPVAAKRALAFVPDEPRLFDNL